jgi:hypothetical protein
VWDVTTGQCLSTFPFDTGVTAVALSRETPYRVVVGLGDGQVQFFQLESLS